MSEDNIKNDEGKARHSLIPPEALTALAKLYTFGAAKYGSRSWERGTNWSRMYDAMIRHATAWNTGEDWDVEDDFHHLIGVAFYALALYTYHQRGVGEDDRIGRVSFRPKGGVIFPLVQQGSDLDAGCNVTDNYPG
jgi:hypothetical protein